MAGAIQEPEVQPAIPAIYHQMPDILDYLKTHQVVIVSSSPGSGKSWLLPILLSRSGYRPVICAQPRHFAMTIAMNRAEDIRNSHVTYTTTRLLVDQFCTQPILTMYHVIVIDEAHERTLGTDVLLGLVKAALASGKRRCKVVVCTAGGSADDKLSEFFGAPVVARLRALHPVEVRHSPGPVIDLVPAAVQQVEAIHASQPPGDVLVFLPELIDVLKALELLLQRSLPELSICMLYDNLPCEHINIVLGPAPNGLRKVVLANDTAETAVLVPGIRYVIDSGIESAHPYRMISKESARRRMSVAGDGAPGRCYRLYTESEHADLRDNSVPHIRREGALVRFLLMLRRHGIDDAAGFEYVDPPTANMLEEAAGQLVADGYLEEHGDMTEKGERESHEDE